MFTQCPKMARPGLALGLLRKALRQDRPDGGLTRETIGVFNMSRSSQCRHAIRSANLKRRIVADSSIYLFLCLSN